LLIFFQEEKERRKRMCSSLTVSRNYEGWIELDVKLALKIWEKPRRNYGLAIDVQDLDDVQLKATEYFHPYNCEQACECEVCCLINKLIMQIFSKYFSFK
jgi:hypothetical protein